MRPAVRPSLLTLPPLIVLALAGCAGEPADERTAAPTVTVTAPPPAPTPTSSVPAASAQPSAPSTTLASIAAAAQRAAGSGTVVSVDEEDAGEARPWDVTVIGSDGAERDLRLDAAGRVLSGPTADDTDADDRAENRRLLAGARTSIDDAASAVLDRSGGRLTELSLDERDDGTVVWEADVEGSPEGVRSVVVDARSGGVLRAG